MNGILVRDSNGRECEAGGKLLEIPRESEREIVVCFALATADSCVECSLDGCENVGELFISQRE